MPRFGEMQAADPWSAATRTLTNPSGVFSDATRTLTDISAEEIFDLPIADDTYAVTPNPSSGAAAGTYGAWTLATADVGAGKRLLWIALIPIHSAQLTFEVELGEGAAGSEAAVARVISVIGTISAVGHRPTQIFYLWKSLSNNARLSVRVKDEEVLALQYAIRVGLA